MFDFEYFTCHLSNLNTHFKFQVNGLVLVLVWSHGKGIGHSRGRHSSSFVACQCLSLKRGESGGGCPLTLAGRRWNGPRGDSTCPQTLFLPGEHTRGVLQRGCVNKRAQGRKRGAHRGSVGLFFYVRRLWVHKRDEKAVQSFAGFYQVLK